VLADGAKAADLINSFPSIYAGRDLRVLITTSSRHKKKKTVAVAMGGHVIKSLRSVPGRPGGGGVITAHRDERSGGHPRLRLP